MLLWILERSGKKTKNKRLDESSASVLGRQRGTVGCNLLNLDYLEGVHTTDAAHYRNILFISLSTAIKTKEIISHSNLKYRLIVYQDIT